MITACRKTTFLVALGAAFFLGTVNGSFTLSCAHAQEADDDQPKVSTKSPHKHKHHTNHHHHKKVARAVYTPQHMASYIVDADSGKILESENADTLHYPASLTKMMTLYLTFEALQKGELTLSQTIPVSDYAAGMPQTNIALSAGERIRIKDAILSIVVRSANDSAVTLGEALGGTESEFAEKMTRKAMALGMHNTVFRNASGLPNPGQHTTARDMATLGIALRRDFPQYFPLFKTESFTYEGTTYLTHNHVMMRYEGVDGIKTGYIRASGYNLVTSANRDGHHIIAVVMGGKTWRSRDDKMIALLDKTFTQLDMLPGDNRVQLAASIKNHKYSSLAAKHQKGLEEEGEGDADK